jgi:aerobic-type carbon monoxide dehydrogenase small subunit (CoxS/CutS family)
VESRNEPTTAVSVNGRLERIRVAPGRSLLMALRGELGLTGSKYGCGEGECGACTVLLGGSAARACQVPVAELGGREVVTIEGLAAPSGALSALQLAFAELGAFQCGFCTPGMIMAATALLDRVPAPTREEVETALEGNLCRCGGYLRILRAVERAVEIRARESP